MAHVRVSAGGQTGHGEDRGVYYQGDDAAHILHGIESVRPRLEAGISRADLQTLRPPVAPAMRWIARCGIWKPS